MARSSEPSGSSLGSAASGSAASVKGVWDAVDDWAVAALGLTDPSLDAVAAASDDAGLPPIAVSPAQGALLGILARAIGARRILEIGALGGYSTTLLARALPEGGRMVTLEYSPEHARVATANLERAGLADVVDVRTGAALDLLPAVAEEFGTVDMVFVDADKRNNPAYLEWALRLTRPGGLVIVDNVVRGGAVVDPARVDPDIDGVRMMMAALKREPRLRATVIQTVGAKGYDGLLIGLRTSAP